MAAEEGWLERLERRERMRQGQMVDLDFLLDGTVVSHVGIRERKVLISGCWIGVGSIGSVATEERYRNRGLATRLMERAIRRIDEDGGDVMFVSGDRGLYRRLGCVGAGIFRKLTAAKRDLKVFEDPSLNVRRAEKQETISLVKIYQAEAVRWHRTLKDFREGLEGGGAPLWRRVEPLLIERDGKSLAYLLVQTPKQDDRERSGILIASEYAGSRTAVLSAARALLEKRGYDRMFFYVPEHDLEMLYNAGRTGMAAEMGTLPGHTFKIVNLKRLIEDLSPCLEDRLDGRKELSFEEGSGKFQLGWGSERLIAEVAEAERIIFGPHSQQLKKRIPKSMQQLFPIPFPWPGLDSF